MGIVIPEGYAQAVFVMQLAGRPRPYGITMGFHDPTGLMNPQAVVNAVAAAAEAEGSIFDTTGPVWSNAYTYLGVNLTYMTSTGPVLESNPAASVGGNVLQPLPPNVSLLCRKSTARGGRKGRGRLFLPPAWIAESNVDSLGVIAGAQVTQIQNFLNVWMGEITAGPLDAVLFHEDPLTAPDVILALLAESSVATQRRRLRS